CSRHVWLACLCAGGETTLRACPAIPKRDQHWQMADAEAKRLESRFAKAGETARRQANQVPRRREHIEIHGAALTLAPIAMPVHTCICKVGLAFNATPAHLKERFN